MFPVRQYILHWMSTTCIPT